MERQRRRDTGPELALRRALHAVGLRYRVNYPVPGRARRTIDIVFPARRVAVFVDGCFWHGCPQHAVQPRHNRDWWVAKIAANKERDKDTEALLTANGWTVVRLWEHESLAAQVSAVQRALVGPQAGSTDPQ